MTRRLSLPIPQPKGASRVDARTDQKRDLEKQDLAWRTAVKTRDHWQCQICGRKVKLTIALDPARAEADHVFPKSTYPELRHVVENGYTACLLCHQLAHRDRTLVPDAAKARAEVAYRRLVLGEGTADRSLV